MTHTNKDIKYKFFILTKKTKYNLVGGEGL